MDLQGQLKVNKRWKKENNRLYTKKFWLIVKVSSASPANKGSFIILNIILKQRFISCNLYFFKNSENSFNFENPFYKQQELGNLKSF